VKLCGKLMDNILISEARVRLTLVWAIWKNAFEKSLHEKK